MTVYRNEELVRDERKNHLEGALAVLDDEIASVERQLEGRGGSLLDRVQIASPCPVRWADMVGGERERTCLRCDKSVFNLSAMTRAEGEAFLESRVGLDTCISIFKRADGKLVTADCPPPTKRRVYLILGGVSGIVALMACATTLSNTAGGASDTQAQKVTAPLGAPSATAVEQSGAGYVGK